MIIRVPDRNIVKINLRPPAKDAFTMIDGLVVIVSLGIMFFLLLWAARRAAEKHHYCSPLLKQIGLAFKIYAGDNRDKYPMEIITNNELLIPKAFQMMSNELNNPKILICPRDVRHAASNFNALKAENISYFLSIDAKSSMTNAILAGDRNLRVYNQPVKSGLFIMNSNRDISWTGKMHDKCGNILFVNGLVELSTNNLSEFIQRQNLSANRLIVP